MLQLDLRNQTKPVHIMHDLHSALVMSAWSHDEYIPEVKESQKLVGEPRCTVQYIFRSSNLSCRLLYCQRPISVIELLHLDY